MVMVLEPTGDLAQRLAAHLETGTVGPKDLARARAAAAAADKRLDQALVELGIVTEEALTELFGPVLEIEDFDPRARPLAPVLGDLLSPTYLASAQVLPVTADLSSVTLAMVDPLDDFTAKAIGLKVGRAVIRQRIPRVQFDPLFAEIYGEQSGLTQFSEDETAGIETGDLDVLRDAASDAPVIRFVQEMIRRAVQANASDIHLKPLQRSADLQFRIDGRLVSQNPPEGGMLSSIISRLKILANLDISERRLPQDGRIRTNVGGRPIDIRVSTMPHIHGEGAVLRLLSRDIAVSSLAELGFSAGIQQGLSKLFGATEGLVLVTGPTGSGKSTTLHAALKRLIRPGVNIVTIEDPVEYRVDGVSQVQVDEKIGLTFPRVLRSLLRQDPDIILVGEIRDAETAKIAVQAALTGHLVLATLHTNSALAAVPRLIDMGVEPYLLAAVLRGVLAQRLVRRLCRSCATDRESGLSHAGAGCDACGNSGFRGRVALGELALLDAELTEALARTGELSPHVMDRLRRQDYRPLREDALSRLSAGEIDPSDVVGLIDV